MHTQIKSYEEAEFFMYGLKSRKKDLKTPMIYTLLVLWINFFYSEIILTMIYLSIKLKGGM